jgi:hypothetical protein
MSEFAERTDTGIRGRLYLENFQVRRGAVTITVENESGESWQLVFDFHLAVRVADEGYRLVSAPRLPPSGCGCRVLEARDSEFIRWVREESGGMTEVMIHTVVLTVDDIVEVVSFEPAVVHSGRATE